MLFSSLIAEAGNTISANVANYNSLLIQAANGTVTVPSNPVLATYTVTAGFLPTQGSSFVVTLPTGFLFSTQPSITSTGASTFTLASGGIGSQSATFTIQSATAASGDMFKIGGFTVNGAGALAAGVPLASALPITMQAIGIDASPLSAGAFASQAASATGIFVGAIQFIDENSPSNGHLFGQGTSDSATAVMWAFAGSLSGSTLLRPNGTAFSLSNETFSLEVDANYIGIATAFLSTTSDCQSPYLYGTVNPYSVIFSGGVPVNQEVFGCVTAAQTGPALQPYAGICSVTFGPAPGETGFTATLPVNVEFGGEVVPYGSGNSPTNPGCQPPSTAIPTTNRYVLYWMMLMFTVVGLWAVRKNLTDKF